MQKFSAENFLPLSRNEETLETEMISLQLRSKWGHAPREISTHFLRPFKNAF